jgi:hypothetical protein
MKHHAMKSYGGVEISSFMLKLTTRWRCEHFHAPADLPPIPNEEPQSRSGCCGDIKEKKGMGKCPHKILFVMESFSAFELQLLEWM